MVLFSREELQSALQADRRQPPRYRFPQRGAALPSARPFIWVPACERRAGVSGARRAAEPSRNCGAHPRSPRRRQTPSSSASPVPQRPSRCPNRICPSGATGSQTPRIEGAKSGRHREARTGRGHERGERLSPVPSPRPPEETSTPRQTSAPPAPRRAEPSRLPPLRPGAR